MTSKIIKYAVWAGMLASALIVPRLVPSFGAQQSATTVADALRKARVLDRLAEGMSVEHKGTAPGFLETKCRKQDGGVWPAREHGIYVDQNDFVYVAGNGQARNFHGQFPWAPNFGNDSQILKFKPDGTFVYQIGTAGVKGPNSNDTNGGVNGTPEPYWPADMVVGPKTNIMYIADGYGNRPRLIVDAATGKYVGHFGAYGQNPA